MRLPPNASSVTGKGTRAATAKGLRGQGRAHGVLPLPPFPQPTPGPWQPSPPRPAPSEPRCGKRSAVRGGGTGGGLHAENARGLLPRVPATTRIGDPRLQSGSRATGSPVPGACRAPGPPVLQPPVLAPFTSAGPVSPAPRAHRGSSAAAPPGFLHLQGGSNAAGETAHEGFWSAFPPPSALLSQHENVPILPPAPAGFHVPQTSPRVSTTGAKPHQTPTTHAGPQTLQAPPRGDPAGDPGWGLTFLGPVTVPGAHGQLLPVLARLLRRGTRVLSEQPPPWCWTASQKEHHRVARGSRTRHPPAPLTSLTRSTLCSLPATTPSGCPWGLLILPGDREGGGSGVAASPCQPRTSLDGDLPHPQKKNKQSKTTGVSQRAQAGRCPPKHLHIFKDIPSTQEQL